MNTVVNEELLRYTQLPVPTLIRDHYINLNKTKVTKNKIIFSDSK